MTSADIKIKICGIMSLEDALSAIDAGADYLGFIFAHGSARRVEESAAKEIIAGIEGRAKIVGVFKDQDISQVAKLVESLNLDYTQCHGGESVQYIRQIPSPVIRTIELDEGSQFERALEATIEVWKDCVDVLLFDRPKSISDPDWQKHAVADIVAVAPLPLPFFFAGGLSAENVGSVLESLSPFGVDVASSVECAPGKKDVGKMIDFCKAVRRNGGGVSVCAH